MKQKLIRLSGKNDKHLKMLAKKYEVSETKVVNLFLEKSRDTNTQNIYEYLEQILGGEKYGRK